LNLTEIPILRGGPRPWPVRETKIRYPECFVLEFPESGIRIPVMGSDTRQERSTRPRGINNADISGSRIPSATERDAAQRISTTSARWNAAIAAGHNPRDYGYDETGRKVGKPKEQYESARRSRMGLPAAGTTPAKVDFLTNPDPDKDGIPNSIQAPGTGTPVSAAKPAAKPAAPAAPAGFPGGKIDGKPAWQVLQESRIRTEGEDSTPSAAERRNKDEFLAWEASRQDAADMAGATPTGAPAVKKPDAVATPTPTAAPAPKPEDAPIVATVVDEESTPGKKSGHTLGDYYEAGARTASAAVTPLLGLGALGARATRSTDRLVGKATQAWNAATDMTNTANRSLRRVGSLEHGLARITKDIVPRATTFTANAASEAARLKTAATGARVMAGKLGVENTYDAARAAAQQSKKADRLAHFTRRAGQRGVATADKLKTARTVATELKDEAAKLTAKSDKLGAAANKAAGKTTLKAAGKLASKAAVPLEVGMMAVEGARLLGSGKHREARAKEFEQYADKGALRSAAESALNPVAGIYSAGHQISKRAESVADAKAAEGNYNKAKSVDDRRQALLAESGATRESLRAMPIKERLALLKSIRDRARTGSR
jgi:hypothetical protein